MSLLRFTLISLSLGLIIPLILLLVGGWFDYFSPANLPAQLYFQYIVLMLWPVSIINVGGAGGGALAIQLIIISLALNVIFYGLLGVLIWLGIKKQRWLLVILCTGIFALWWRLLTL